MRKIIIGMLVIFICNLSTSANELEKYIENNSVDGRISEAGLLIKKITVLDAAASNFTINVLESSIKISSMSNISNSLAIPTKTFSSDFYEMFYKSMYEAPSEKSMRSILSVISGNDESFKLIENEIINKSMTIKKFNKFKKDLGTFGKGLSTAGFLFSAYGFTKDIQNVKDMVSGGKAVLSAYGVFDGAIGLASLYKLPWAKNGFVKSFSGAALQKFNLGLGIFQISSTIVQADRDKAAAVYFNALFSTYNLLNDDAQKDISKINKFLFDNNKKSLTFSDIFSNNDLNIFSVHGKKKVFTNEYANLTSDTDYFKDKFGKNTFSELDQYEKLFIIQHALRITYSKVQNNLVKEMLGIVEQGDITFDINGVRNIYIGFLSAGSGWDVYNDMGKMLEKIIENEKYDLIANMRSYYAMDFTHKARILFYEKGKLLEAARKQASQKRYDDNHAKNKSYKTKVHDLSGIKYMVSFNYDADDRIDKCVVARKFSDGLIYLIGKDFSMYGDESTYMYLTGNYENSDKVITIKEALYLIDMYSSELFKSIGYSEKYEDFFIKPMGKLLLKDIYKKAWYKSFNQLGLEAYIKRQYTQMQGSTIGLDKNNMNNLNQCLRGYQAVDLLRKYDKTLWYYKALKEEK